MRQIWLVLYPDANLLDIAGPLQVFATASEQAPEPCYEIRVFSRDGGLVRTSCGVELASEPLSAAGDPGGVTLMVAGGHGSDQAMYDGVLTGWLRETGPRAERTASVCTGAFLLAEAGLLSGRRAGTHWDYCERLARDHPDIAVEPDALASSRVVPGTGTRSVGVVIMHELGHLVGLDHVNDTQMIMAPAISTYSTWGAGDLAGLKRVGAGNGCLPTPALPNPGEVSANSLPEDTGLDVISRVDVG